MRFLSAPVIFPIHIEPITDGIIVVDDKGKILDLLDPAKNEIPSFLPIEKFDGVLCPGFVNAHCHLELSHLKGKFTQKKGLPFFISEMVTADRSQNTDSLNAMEDADREMHDGGIVAVGDISNTIISSKVKIKSEIFYHTFIELFDIFPERADGVLAKGLTLEKVLVEAGLQSSIVPHAPYTVSEKLMRLISKEAEKSNRFICIHNQETVSENEMYEKGTGELIEMLNKMTGAFKDWKATGKSSLKSFIDNLPRHQPLQLVHNTFSNRDDIRFSQSKIQEKLYFCICANANLFIENALPDIEMLMNENCILTIGTDSYASNLSLSILDELKTISFNFPRIKLEDMLAWATINGATFLGINSRYGSFEKGKTPGVNLVSNIETNTLKLSKNSTVKRVV